MLRVLTAEQSRELERRTVAGGRVSLADLMERAGEAVAEEVSERFPVGAVVVAAGSGNNGGDGWVAARILHKAGREVVVASLRVPDDLSGIAGDAARAAVNSGVSWTCDTEAFRSSLRTAAVAIDALLGTGARLPLEGDIAEWCEALSQSGAPVLSVDLPTGISTDGGAVDELAVRADVTVTFTAPKMGLVTYPAAAHVGELSIVDIGVNVDDVVVGSSPEVWTDDEFAALVPVPGPMTHKNTRGRVLIVAGSGRYPGAAVLAVRGAMRSGAGYVTLAAPESVVGVLQTHLIASPVVGLPASRARALSSTAAAEVLRLAADYDAVVLGPGITLSDGAAATARTIFCELDKPLVVDADALNALVDAQDLILGRSAPTVLTPHPGELARLLGESAGSVQADRVSSATRLAGNDRVVVLKGAGTVVSSLGRSVIITAGTPALATAGSGDVLSGVIGALLAQGLDTLEASALGVHVHGRAGEAAAAQLGSVSVTAEDVPEYLPYAFRELLEFE